MRTPDINFGPDAEQFHKVEKFRKRYTTTIANTGFATIAVVTAWAVETGFLERVLPTDVWAALRVEKVQLGELVPTDVWIATAAVIALASRVLLQVAAATYVRRRLHRSAAYGERELLRRVAETRREATTEPIAPDLLLDQALGQALDRARAANDRRAAATLETEIARRSAAL